MTVVVEELQDYTRITVSDYDSLDHVLSFDANKERSKPVLITFTEGNSFTRYIEPPRYHADGKLAAPAIERIYDQKTQRWVRTTYTETVAKHTIRVKPVNGYDYPFVICGIRERDLKDKLFMQGLLFDEWDPYLTREKERV